jgi:putative FmdB family regulatory protein
VNKELAEPGVEEFCTVPTYTYKCKKCGSEFDVFHAISADPRVKCEACGGGCKRQLGTGAGIIFKGSGFYETDYKKSGAKTIDKSSSGGEPKSETKTETKSETKSDAKSDTKAGKTEHKSAAAKKN